MGIMPFIQAHQLYIMFFMSGICGTLVFLTTKTGVLYAKRKQILILLESSAMILLFCDCLAYLYRGDVSTVGYWMVRLSNFMVYLCTLFLPYGVSLYLRDLFSHEGSMQNLPRRLTVCKAFFVAGLALLVVSQVTGLYYTFDAQNRYQRAPANALGYVFPLAMVLIQLSAIIQYRKLLTNRMTLALTLHLVMPVVAAVLQFFTYGVSLVNMTLVGMVIYLYICALSDMNDSLQSAREKEIEAYKESRTKEHILFEQTTAALASAIDAKDEYTHGHSSRVAMYSELIAMEFGLSDAELEKVYFAALLHDVGKIGVDDAIIRKEGRLTNEEFAQIKLHPVYGSQILCTIRESPYLSLGAKYHHERYDGRGYPEGLAGEDIPQIARIIAVADAYDAMTSQRSYRDVRPQHLVREELVKGMGTQFDPQFARIMLHYIDLDYEYNMHQQLKGMNADLVEGLNAKLETSVRCDELFHGRSTGIRIIDRIVHFHLVCVGDEGCSAPEAQPTLILFDSLDGLVHKSGDLEKNRRYFEYAQIRADGHTFCTEARKAQTSVVQKNDTAAASQDHGQGPRAYEIEAARFGDHVQIRISDGAQTIQTIVALPFSGRFSYISLTGEHCTLTNMQFTIDQEPIDASYIPRIAEEVSYIRDHPEGDIPNMQIEGHRAKTTQGIPITHTMRLTFHVQALPNARIIWHCPYLSVFTSNDGTATGADYKEFVLLRLDGEELEDNVLTLNGDTFRTTPDFKGWEAWKEGLKQGIDCEVIIRREGNTVCMETENLGIATRSVTTLPDDLKDLYVALTGDQCAITNIRVH